MVGFKTDLNFAQLFQDADKRRRGMELLVYAEAELGYDPEELTPIAQAIEHPARFDEEMLEHLRTIHKEAIASGFHFLRDDAAPAIARQARRFAERAPKTKSPRAPAQKHEPAPADTPRPETTPAPAAVPPTPAWNATQAEYLERFADESRVLAQKIEANTATWAERYGDAGAQRAEAIVNRLHWLIGERDRAQSLRQLGYLHDVVDALRILINRVDRTELELGRANPSGSPFSVHLHGLFTPPTIQSEALPIERVPRTHETRPRNALPFPMGESVIEPGTVIPALESVPRAGLLTPTRPHQLEILNPIGAYWALHRSRIEEEPVAEASIVAPTGSGKTHEMAATIEIGMREGWLQMNDGGKAFILTHLRRITGQNEAAMKLLLDPVFRKRLGRPIRVTKVDADGWDLSGDAVLVSVPTAGRKTNAARFAHEAQVQFADRAHPYALTLLDEYHHGIFAATWRRTIEAIADAATSAFNLGFSATIPQKLRARANVIAEQDVLDLMRRKVLPPVTYAPVRMGVDLKWITTTGHDLNQKDLSQTVRTLEHHYHLMRALEDHGIRSGRGGFAPTLHFGVDVAHIEEFARYYQWYFSKEDRYGDGPARADASPAMGVRQIAVITEEMSRDPKAVKRLIDAYRAGRRTTFERFVFGEKADTGAFRSIGEYTGKIDGIIAVMTAKTPENVRDMLMEASKPRRTGPGAIETLLSIGVIGEGADIPWAQNIIPDKPTLSEIPASQNPGRAFRHDKWHIESDGTVVYIPPRIIIEPRYDRPDLVTVLDALGITDHALARIGGAQIDLVTEAIGRQGYGHLSDVWKSNAETKEVERKPVVVPQPEELIPISGVREHVLLPQRMVGEMPRLMRHILQEDYEGKLAEMAFDLAVSEATLVGYLNGRTPSDARLLARMGIFLYQGRDVLARQHKFDENGWVPRTELNAAIRPLVQQARDQSFALFGATLPRYGFTTTDGWRSGPLNLNPVIRFLRDGKIPRSFRGKKGNFWTNLRQILMNVERDAQGNHVHVPEHAETRALIEETAAAHAGWTPIEELDDSVRALVRIARENALVTDNGGLIHPREAGDEVQRGVQAFLRDGTIAPAGWKPLWELLHQHVTPAGKARAAERDDVIEAFHAHMERTQHWKRIETIPEGRRPLVEHLRTHRLRTAGGTPMGNAALDAFFQSGAIVYNDLFDPNEFWDRYALTVAEAGIAASGAMTFAHTPPHITRQVETMRRIGLAVWKASDQTGDVVHPANARINPISGKIEIPEDEDPSKGGGGSSTPPIVSGGGEQTPTPEGTDTALRSGLALMEADAAQMMATEDIALSPFEPIGMTGEIDSIAEFQNPLFALRPGLIR